MKNTFKTLAAGGVIFLGSAALAFWIGGSVATDEVAAEATMPAFEEPLPVITPVPFDGDPRVAAETLAEQVNASRITASEIGVVLEPSAANGIETASVVSSTDAETPSDRTDATTTVPDETTSTTATPTSTIVPDTGEDTRPPAAGTPPAEETVTDLCVFGDESCPEGISGTILAIHALPPLAGVANFRPAALGAGYSLSSPECPSRLEEEGSAHFGVATNRPATITMEYKTREWRESQGAIPWTTVTLSTTADADSAWAAADASDPLDPNVWIQTCFTLEDLPPRSDYVARFQYADKDDPSVTATNFVRFTRFIVPGRDGLDPGAQRRPTTLLPLGVDQLFVGMTRTPDQEIAVAARPGTDPSVCDIAGNAASIYSGDGTVRASLIGDEAIDRDLLNDPSYPYLIEHTRSVVTRLDLTEGTNYIVCIYWLGEGPAFDALPVEIAESVPIATPEAYRPTVVVHGLTNLVGDPDRVAVNIPGCGGQNYDLTTSSSTMTDGSGALQTTASSIELCTFTIGLNELDRRGIRIDTRAVTPDGTSYSSGIYLRTELECRMASCLLRLPEIALVPLPRIPVPDSDCGSGFGTGCLSDGLRSAGDLIIELRFDSASGTGISSWSIGDAAEFDDTAPALPENPRIDVQTEVEPIGHLSQGSRANITVVADRPVSLSVESSVIDGTCTFGDAGGYNSAALAVTHSFTLSPLCIGYDYLLAVTAVDESGRVAEIFGDVRFVDEGFVRLRVPWVLVTTELSITVTAPTNDRRHTILVSPVITRTDDVVTGYPHVRSLGWTWPRADRAAALAAGWQMYGLNGRASACGQNNARPLEVFARRTAAGIPINGTAFVTQEGTHITLQVDIYENRPVGGSVVGPCALGDLVESVELSTDLSIDDLFDGVTLSSDSGSVVFTIQARGFRR